MKRDLICVHICAVTVLPFICIDEHHNWLKIYISTLFDSAGNHSGKLCVHFDGKQLRATAVVICCRFLTVYYEDKAHHGVHMRGLSFFNFRSRFSSIDTCTMLFKLNLINVNFPSIIHTFQLSKIKKKTGAWVEYNFFQSGLIQIRTSLLWK